MKDRLAAEAVQPPRDSDDRRFVCTSASQPFWLAAQTIAALTAVSEREGVSLSVTLLAVFQTLLHRYTAREDVSVGVFLPDGSVSGDAAPPPSALRAARAGFAGDPPFRELLRSVKLEPSEALETSVPPSAVTRSAGEGVPISRFDSVLFGFGGPSPSEREFRYGLALSLSREEGRLRGDFFYDSGLFDPPEIDRLRGHFLVLLEGAAADPGQRVGMLPLLTPAERRRILIEWNDSRREYSSEPNVARLFEKQAERTPDAMALAFGDDRLSYRELDARSNRLARGLRTLGVSPGVLVGICMERSLETAVAVLGVLKAGGAYVPLDPEYPRERLEFMLEDSGASVVLTDERRESAVQSRGAKIIVLDSNSTRQMLAGQEDTPPLGGAGPEDLAYVIYTSGSTGKPKGVSMPHRALLNLIAWQIESARNPAAKTLQFASLSFDVSFQEMFSTWCAGGTLLLLPEQVRRDAVALWRLLESESVERLFLPFVALQHLAEAAEREGLDAPSLHEVITAGEQLRITPQIARLFPDGGSRVLQNQYGPSESHVVTAFTLTGPPRSWPTLPPIGRPISNTCIYLLDPHRQPVPVGLAGELYIGGAGVAHGYWKRGELTAERFVPDPFSGDSASRLYRTGDLARYRADGEIEFLGRLDHQVKIRGYRVEPGEIAAALGQHPDVRESVVITREDETGEHSLVAYVVVGPDRMPPSFELRAFLKGKIPDYMVPSAFVSMDSLPLTPSGKVDRRALPAPRRDRPELEMPFVAPRDACELGLVRIWEKALHVESVGIRDDFFELGGHSLIAGRLFAEIRKSFGKSLPPTVLLRAPTIEQLARVLRGREETSRWSSLVPIQAGGSRPPLFCIHAGAGTILFYYGLARELGPDQPVYGLQAQGLYGRQPPHTRVEEMAAHYLREIREVQPKGPYFLAGFCFGAILAFEMAHQLRGEGERVAFLGSFDGAAPGYAGGNSGARDSVRSRAALHWAKLRSLSLSARVVYFVKRVRSRSKSAFRALVTAFCLAARRPLPPWIRQDFFLFSNQRAEWAYVPRVYPGRMVIFESQGSFRDVQLGWGELLAEGLEIHEIPGEYRNHRDLMTGDFIREITGRLKQCLRSATEGAQTQESIAAS